MKNILDLFGNVENISFLCTRKSELLVPWMSGLVSGLQNRVRRFESARNLKRKSDNHQQVVIRFSFIYDCFPDIAGKLLSIASPKGIFPNTPSLRTFQRK